MQKQKLLLSIIPLLILLSCAGNQPQPQKSSPDPFKVVIPVDTLIHKGKLDNGLTYYIRKNAKPENRVELRLALNAGSILETDEQQGLAHLCEHMAFNGSKHFQKQELINYLESIGMRFGADLNAYTSFDETIYMLQVPSDSAEILENGFQVLQDWAQFVSYESEEIDKERNVVIEEWRLGRGAQQRVLDKQLPVLLRGSRYANRLPIGKKTVLDTFKHESLRDFYNTWYHPALMAVVVVGDIEVPEMEKLIHKYFDPLTNPEPLPKRSTFEVPGHDETLFSIASDPETPYSSISVYNILPRDDQPTEGHYREGIVERLFSSMFNQRLNELAQSEDPPFMYGYGFKGSLVRPMNNYGLSAMVASGGIARGLETLLTEARRVEEFGFTESELIRAKKSMLRSMKKAFAERDKQESRQYAAEFIRNFLMDESIPGIGFELDLHIKYLPGISLTEVNGLAENWVKPKNRVVLVSVPQKEGLPVPDEDELKQIISESRTLEISAYEDDTLDQPLLAQVPTAGSVTQENYISELDVTEWTLQNGIKVILKPTDFKNDEIRFTSFSPGGYSHASLENLTAAQTATSLISSSGFGPFSQIQLRKQLAGKVVHVQAAIGELTEALSGSASPKDLETMFQLLYLTFTAPRADSAAFLSFRSRMKGYLENKDASPDAVYSDSVSVIFSGHHPRYLPADMSLLDELDLQKSLSFYKDRFADAGDFTFIFVGNFSLEQMRPLIETYLGGLPTIQRKETWKDVTYDYPDQKIETVFHLGVDQKSKNTFFFSGSYKWNAHNNALLHSLTGVLRIKLRERLREDKGGTYGVGVNWGRSHYPRQRFKVTISFGCDPERIDELSTEIFAQIDSLQKFGFEESYLDKVKEISSRELETSLKKNGFWLGKLKSAYYDQVDPREILTLDDRIQQLTMKEIQEAAQRYINLDKYVRVASLPEAPGQ